MPTPDFILSLREKIGTHPLWLSGVTVVVLRAHPGVPANFLERILQAADGGPEARSQR